MEIQNNRDTEAENSGGTINLSPEQLKEEPMTSHVPGQNPDNIANPDDLHEIQAGDDLNEPDVEGYQPGEEETNNAAIREYEATSAGYAHAGEVEKPANSAELNDEAHEKDS